MHRKCRMRQELILWANIKYENTIKAPTGEPAGTLIV